MQTALKKRKTGMSPLKTGAMADAHDMKEGNIVNEINPAASSILRKRRRTAMGVRFSKMAPLRSLHEVSFRNLVEEHENGVGEELSRKANFVMLDPFRSVRRNRKDYLAEYDVF